MTFQGLLSFWAQFHRRSTYSFYARRSPMRKKRQSSQQCCLALFGSTSVKVVRKTLMKLTPDGSTTNHKNILTMFLSRPLGTLFIYCRHKILDSLRLIYGRTPFRVLVKIRHCKRNLEFSFFVTSKFYFLSNNVFSILVHSIDIQSNSVTTITVITNSRLLQTKYCQIFGPK